MSLLHTFVAGGLLFLASVSGRAAGQVVTLPAVADTGLYEVGSTNNLGLAEAVPAGAHAGAKRSRFLVRFDPAGALPAGAQVTGVALKLQVTVASTPVEIYGVHRMLRDWVEGNQGGNNGAPAAPGETTWRAQYHPVVLWTQPGGAAAVDYLALPSATSSLAGDGSTNWITSGEMAGDVQAWLDQPASNHGWMIRAVNETVPQTVRRIASRETPGGPELIVRYELPDADHDGVPDTGDECLGTAPGAIVNAHGCSLEQLVPANGNWANHGQYIAALAAAADEFARAGLITHRQRAEIIRHAARSPQGR